MSKIVVHRVLLYSIVQHKVWFLFRIIKWKTSTSCRSLLYESPFFECAGWHFCLLRVPGKAREPLLASRAPLCGVSGPSPGGRGPFLTAASGTRRSTRRTGAGNSAGLFPQRVGSGALVRSRLGNSRGLRSAISPFRAADAAFHGDPALRRLGAVGCRARPAGKRCQRFHEPLLQR